ncbi:MULTISPECIES: 4'-phosphopantetheinyl transferase family protein [Acinetobacter]|jgi:4'-phosphopantetheinyl transferase|uniref:4'-phosphopantetheinyl transferase superfamily protein n=1 Tax=Acinetobacter geminorum TaxID=2730922 RepID=A0ABT8Z9H7_9GAMM|nr:MULTISPECIES: 4'-phosphopantetheinyl transferase superfamily protein [Acinetobacter]MBJ8502858.1 4'-phosphopantetheinyl transferase superfamily protein [Acinetobacter pittii]MBJ9893830.1 4'-phosphopantetheinyl transferase superfamily protein [Acinetobacter pittii]MCU4363217.1 4'-phosphopantetheinyl transferase superfamily protein [Acinetobacter sp. WU_MDCI_Abxc22]MCU4479850.1 4'-phosphopantetheinyl transferase superfamily protein [Acinetobacter sp. WU_MDCI_Abxd143]MDO7361377.1 4'-phosphopan
MSNRDQVRVYVCPVSRVPQDHLVLSHYLGFLSLAEKLRYDQYHPKAARLFLISRVLVKTVLADKLGISPHEVNIQLHPNGKPFVEGSKAVYFNLSHSANIIVLAVTEAGEIGIDVEQVDREFEWRRVDSVLASSEIEWIKQNELIDPSSVYQRFFQIWTLKEAYIKCTGEGMSCHLKKLNFHVLPEHIQFLDSTNDAQKTEEYYFESYIYDCDFIFSICLQQSLAQESFHLDCFQLLPCISMHRITPTLYKYN